MKYWENTLLISSDTTPNLPFTVSKSSDCSKMPPLDDPLARLHGRATFNSTLTQYWRHQQPPVEININPCIYGDEIGTRKQKHYSILYFKAFRVLTVEVVYSLRLFPFRYLLFIRACTSSWRYRKS